jgi:glycosyltransferase involved in cell wall biosynthesis
MHILIINWRDPKSPLEGGAERFTQKYAEFWVSQGHTVTWLTNSFFGCEKKETHKGVDYIRIGPILDGSLLRYFIFYPVYLLRSILFARRFIQKENIDVVIDEIHGLPFFTPLFSKTRNVLLVCEVADEIWSKMFPFPISSLGKIAEKLVYSLYKKSEIWAISNNTKKNIESFLPGKPIKIIPLGVDANVNLLKKIRDVKKTSFPSAVFLARLVKMKGIETALYATAQIVKDLPNFKLFILGDGDSIYKKHLTDLVTTLKIQKNIEFVGKVSELEKFSYLKQSHLFIHPSYKEGFGLTVLESNLVGTPALVRSGSSLEELVTHGKNGFVFQSDDQLAPLVTTFFKDRMYSKLSDSCTKAAQAKLWQTVLPTFTVQNEKHK